MDAHQHVRGAVHVALDHRQVVLAVDDRAVADRGPLAELRGQAGGGAALDQSLGAAAVLDEVGDRDELEPVLGRVGHQVGHAGHRAVVVGDLADHAGRDQPREAGEVDRRLGVAGALQHAAGLGAQREDVARLDQVLGPRVGVDRDHDRARAVGRRDAGGDAVAGLDRLGEGGRVGRLVAPHHRLEAELVAALLGEREADQPAPVRRHEVDGLGGGELRRHHQVALVLAVLGVEDHHHAPGADLLDRVGDGGEAGGAARHSASSLGRPVRGARATPRILPPRPPPGSRRAPRPPARAS